jgi:hypothetical protein
MAKNQTSRPSISFEIRGYDRVKNSLRAAIAAHPKDVDEVMRQWAEDTRMFLKRTRYPAKPANSRYVRTGRLASSWKKDQVKPGVWAITNDVTGPKGQFYARYVVGEKDGPVNQRQTRVHLRNNWWRADEVVEQLHIPELRAYLEELYVNLWDE